MNGPFNTAGTAIVIPSEFEVLAPPPLLLPDERFEHYQMLRQAILTDLAPRSAIEWSLAFDVAELSWEIRRYRILRHRALDAYREKAIEGALRRIDMVGIISDSTDRAEYFTVQNALSWRFDPIAASEIEERLAAYGFDHTMINMEAYVQAREIFSLFEGLLNAAQARRLLLLKEINSWKVRCPVFPPERPRIQTD